MLADDHATLRKAVRAVLENSGFAIAAEADNGVHVLNLLRSGVDPEALILDLTMPEMSGVDALLEIRRMGRDLKVLTLTMHDEPEFICRAFRAGANGYMLKEAAASDLVRGLLEVLDSRIYVSPQLKNKLPEACSIRSSAGLPVAAALAHCK